jgi:hypothetical protein
MKVGLVPELIELEMYWGEAIVDFAKIDIDEK